MNILQLTGSHRQMGQQHASQMQTLRPAIVAAIAARETELAHLTYDYRPVLAEVNAFMNDKGRPTWDMLRGIGEGLDLDWEQLQRYTLSSFLLDYQHKSETGDETSGRLEGCTSFAASPLATIDNAPLLAKNRDYRYDHIALQSLTFSVPAQGYRYLHLGSVGSPGVFSSGMNERGLAVADTHVLSVDIGVGLPRYALMMDILERCDSIPAAIDYLHDVRHMGAGTLVMADAEGRLGVCESAYLEPYLEANNGGWVVRTNHFMSAQLKDIWLDTDPPEQRNNSVARFDFVSQAMTTAMGTIDSEWARALLCSHEGNLSGICRHTETGALQSTILGVIFLPKSKEVLLAAGQPCQTDWQRIGMTTLEHGFES